MVTDYRCLLTGYRLGADRKYQPIQPDPQGFLLSETTRLRFGVAEDGKTVHVFDVVTGKRLLTSSEMEEALKAAIEARQAAEERIAQDTAGRREAEERIKVAEAENAHLRAELERIRQS